MPSRLTSDEVAVIETMVVSGEHRFMSVRALALYAQRVEKVFASPTTWYRLIRRRGWRRPRSRVYPPKPKIGARATAPGELLHLDVTIIKLLDRTRVYLHAIIDNYSRRIDVMLPVLAPIQRHTITSLRELRTPNNRATRRPHSIDRVPSGPRRSCSPMWTRRPSPEAL
jgi:hypothetical protein